MQGRCAHHKVAIAQSRDAAALSHIVRVISTHEAVERTDRPCETRASISPGDGSRINTGSVVPFRAAHGKVAVVQCGHESPHLVSVLSPEQTVGLTDCTRYSGGSVPPGRSSGHQERIVGPIRAAHHIVSIAQGGHSDNTNPVEGLTADEAVRGTDDPTDSCHAAAPGDGSCIGRRAVVPVGADDDEVAITESGHAVGPNVVVGV